MQQLTAIPPNKLTADQRVLELSTILANAMLRQTPSTSFELMDYYSDFSLAISPEQNVHIS